jgi:hypothetical protein
VEVRLQSHVGVRPMSSTSTSGLHVRPYSVDASDTGRDGRRNRQREQNAHRVGRKASVKTFPEHSKFGARVQEVGPIQLRRFRERLLVVATLTLPRLRHVGVVTSGERRGLRGTECLVA